MEIKNINQRFQLGKLFSKYILIEALSYLSLQHALHKLNSANSISKRFLYDNYTQISSTFKQSKVYEIRLDQMEQLTNLKPDQENFLLYTLKLTKPEDLDFISRNLKYFLKQEFILKKITLIDAQQFITGNDCTNTWKTLKAIKTTNLTLNINTDKVEKSFQIINKLNSLKIKSKDLSILDKIRNIDTMKVKNLYLVPENLILIERIVMVLMFNSYLNQVVIHKVKASDVFKIFESIDPQKAGNIFKKLTFNQIQIRKPLFVKKTLQLVDKYQFALNTIHFQKMILDNDDTFRMLQLSLHATMIIIQDAFTFQEQDVDSTLMSKAQSLALLSKIREIQFDYLEWDPEDPLLQLFKILISKSAKKISFSIQSLIQNNKQQASLLTYDYEKLEQLQILQTPPNIAFLIADDFKNIKLKSLILEDTILSIEFAEKFQKELIDEIIIKSNRQPDLGILDNFTRGVDFFDKFPNITKLAAYNLEMMHYHLIEYFMPKNFHKWKEFTLHGPIIDAAPFLVKTALVVLMTIGQSLFELNIMPTNTDQMQDLEEFTFDDMPINETDQLRITLIGDNILQVIKTKFDVGQDQMRD